MLTLALNQLNQAQAKFENRAGCNDLHRYELGISRRTSNSCHGLLRKVQAPLLANYVS